MDRSAAPVLFPLHKIFVALTERERLERLVTVVLADAVQPLTGSVTVTKYVPAEVTDLVEPLPPPLQSNVAPPTGEEAERTMLVTEQVKVPGGAMLTVGVTVFSFTVIDVDALQ